MGVLEREIGDRDEREPGFSSLVHSELATITAFDDYVNAILDELAERGMTRAELARAAGMQAANLRRLLTDTNANPTFATLLRVTDALGLDIKVVRRDELATAGWNSPQQPDIRDDRMSSWHINNEDADDRSATSSSVTRSRW